MAAPIPGGAPRSSSARPRRGRILVVDDEPRLGHVLSLLLSSAHHVDVVTSAKGALVRLLSGDRYDIVLCDVMMPEMSGIDFHDEVARMLPAQARRIVFVTGGVTNGAHLARIEASQRTVLTKPVDVEQLRTVVERHVATAAPSPTAAAK
jgi:CheY-like chemotaxis protein